MVQLRLCLLRRLRRGLCDNVLKYERTIMCTLLYTSKWHQDVPDQAHSEELGEGMLSKLVRDRAKNTVCGTHYLILQFGPKRSEEPSTGWGKEATQTAPGCHPTLVGGSDVP